MLTTHQKQTELFNKTGSFFAFSQKQMSEQQVEGETYVSMGGGMICPKANAAALTEGLHKINKEHVELDLKDNGVKKIIHRELANHECQITGDYECVVELLEDYGITEQQINSEWQEFYQHCCDNNYF